LDALERAEFQNLSEISGEPEILRTINKRIADEVELWKISGAVGLGLVWR
jgi:hypothetical protein